MPDLALRDEQEFLYQAAEVMATVGRAVASLEKSLRQRVADITEPVDDADEEESDDA